MGDAGYGWALVKMIVALALVCAGAYLVLRFGLRRLVAPAAGGPIRVIARRPIEPRRSIYLIEAEGRRLLVGSAEGGLTLLADLGPAGEDAAAGPAGPAGAAPGASGGARDRGRVP